MIKIEFAFGIELDKNGQHISTADAERAIDLLITELTMLTGGCSAYRHVGTWYRPADGFVVQEAGCTLVTVVEKAGAAVAGGKRLTVKYLVKRIADSIKRRLNQEAVAVTQTVVQFACL